MRWDTPFYTAGQVAQLFGVHRSRVYQMVKEGKLSPSHLDPSTGTQLFSREYIHREIARRADKAPPDGGAVRDEPHGRQRKHVG